MIGFDWVDIDWQLWLRWYMAFAIWCVASKRYFHQAGFDQLKRLTLDRWARLRAKCFHAWTSSCQHCDSVNFEDEMNFNLYYRQQLVGSDLLCISATCIMYHDVYIRNIRVTFNNSEWTPSLANGCMAAHYQTLTGLQMEKRRIVGSDFAGLGD